MASNNPRINGDKLRQLRTEQRLTQQQLGEEMGRILVITITDPVKNIRRYEQSGRINLRHLSALAQALHVEPKELIFLQLDKVADTASLTFVTGANQREK